MWVLIHRNGIVTVFDNKEDGESAIRNMGSDLIDPKLIGPFMLNTVNLAG